MLMVESKQGLNTTVAPSPSAGRASSFEIKSLEGWTDMSRPPPPPRINILDLKAQIVKRVGPARANKYFSHFRSFISSHLSKQELDKVIILTIGKENVALHNQLVKAILSNAVHAQAPPPPPPAQNVSKAVKGARVKPPSPSVVGDDTLQQVSSSILSNGDALATSPCKARLYTPRERDTKAKKDKSSPLGSHFSPDLSRPVQHIDSAAKQLDAESNSAYVPPLKRLRALQSTSTDSASPLESSNLGLGWEDSSLAPADRLIKAPLGIPFCPGSTDAVRKPPLVGYPVRLLQDVTNDDCLDAAHLPDTESLHRCMEQIAALEGIEGVSRDCANLLNHALDCFLNRLLKACMDCRTRSAQQRPGFSGSMQDNTVKEEVTSALKRNRVLNGVWSAPAAELSRKGREKIGPPISLTDFKVAMDSNPQQLGEDWPVQLEKLSFRLFDQESSKS